MDRDSVEPRVERLPGDRTRQLVEYHHRAAAPSTYVYEFAWDYTAPAIGPFCTDVDGNVLLDLTGQVGVNPLGYNNPKIIDRLEGFDLVDPTKIAGQDFYLPAEGVGDAPVPGPADLMDRLTEITGYGMDTVFLSNSGAEAVENALKVAYDHTNGRYAVTFHGGFHGRTLGTLSLNRSRGQYRRGFPEIASVHDVPFCTDRTCTPETCGCGFFSDDGSALARMLDPETGYVDSDEVGAVVLEPIQGEGGYRFPSTAFTDEVARLCDRHGLPLIADEVQSGMGRTGEWWAVDHYAFEPDVITSAKALRVGATVANEAMFPDETGRLSSTWGAGDLLASAQGVATIDAIQEYDLLANATRQGQALVERLRDAAMPGVTDVRGKGLMIAVEFESSDRRDAVQEQAFTQGVLVLGAGERTIRLLPPLDLTDREVRLSAELVAEAARAV